jgi:hypothetical protein
MLGLLHYLHEPVTTGPKLLEHKSLLQLVLGIDAEEKQGVVRAGGR